MSVKKRVFEYIPAILLGWLVAFAFSTSAVAMEVKVFAIGDFVPTASGGCGGNDIGHWPVMVDKWYDHMGVHGHTKDGQYTNGNMTIQRFADPDFFSGALDYIYADDADALMIAAHGGDNGDHWVATMRYPWSSNCGLDAGGTANDMHLGEIDVEFIHLSSCFSGDDDNIWGVHSAMNDPIDQGSYAHQWDGFHGIMWIGNRFDNDYKEFAHDAHSIAMARSWVNNMYDSRVDCAGYDPWNWFGTCQQQCPVAYSVGTSGNNALSRLNNERYNNVYSDVTHPNFNGAAIRYIVSCDSVGETAFVP